MAVEPDDLVNILRLDNIGYNNNNNYYYCYYYHYYYHYYYYYCFLF